MNADYAAVSFEGKVNLHLVCREIFHAKLYLKGVCNTRCVKCVVHGSGLLEVCVCSTHECLAKVQETQARIPSRAEAPKAKRERVLCDAQVKLSGGCACLFSSFAAELNRNSFDSRRSRETRRAWARSGSSGSSPTRITRISGSRVTTSPPISSSTAPT